MGKKSSNKNPAPPTDPTTTTKKRKLSTSTSDDDDSTHDPSVDAHSKVLATVQTTNTSKLEKGKAKKRRKELERALVSSTPSEREREKTVIELIKGDTRLLIRRIHPVSHSIQTVSKVVEPYKLK